MADLHFAPEDGHGDRYQAWFLVELDRQLQSCDPAVRETTLREAEEHLRCGRMALQELGLPPHEADAEAVKRFGDPVAFAAQVLNAHRQEIRYHVPTLLCAGLVAAYSTIPIFNTVEGPFYWGLAGLLSLLAVSSWVGRSFQWRGLIRMGAVAMAAFGILSTFAWVDLRPYGGDSTLRRQQLSLKIGNSVSVVKKLGRVLTVFDPMEVAFRGTQGQVRSSGYYSHGMYAQLHPLGDIYQPNTYVVAWTPRYDEAAASWQRYREVQSFWHSQHEGALAQAKAARLAQSSGYVLQARPAFIGAATGMLSVLGLALLNGVVCRLRRFSDAVRRRSRRLFA